MFGNMEIDQNDFLLVMLDSCRSSTDRNSRPIGRLGSVSVRGNMAIMFPCERGEAATVNSQVGHGFFTHALIKYLSADARINDVACMVGYDVENESRCSQKPWFYSNLKSLSPNFTF